MKHLQKQKCHRVNASDPIVNTKYLAITPLKEATKNNTFINAPASTLIQHLGFYLAVDKSFLTNYLAVDK